MQANGNTYLVSCLSVCLLVLLPNQGWAFGGTFTVTETWSATFTYSNWGGGNYSGAQTFGGTQTGSIVVSNNSFTMLNRTGFPHAPPPGTSMERLISSGGGFSISGDKVMPYILAGADLNAILYLSGFLVTAKLVDGEIPVFNSFADYETSGISLSAMSGSGNMLGSSLRITVTSTSTWTIAAGPPQITSGPANRLVVVGAGTSFSVAALGNPAPAYQWQRLPAGASTWSNLGNNTNYSGVTTPTLTVAGATETMTGDKFRCVVSNSRGSIQSSAATLTVGTVPLITTQPITRSITLGNPVAFIVSASGSPAPAYQWQRKPAGSSIWGNLANSGGFSGVTTATLMIPNPLPAMSGDQFRCVASNASGSATSVAATLTVKPAVLPTVISGFSTTGGIFQFSFSAQSGSTYSVDFTDQLSGASGWRRLTTVNGGGEVVLVSDPIGSNPRRFYRVESLP